MDKHDHFVLLGNQLQEVAHSLSYFMWFKIPAAIFVGLVSFLIGWENGSAVMALTTLVTFDLLMGMAAAYLNGEPIESRKALKTGTKFAVYLILFSSAYMTENVIGGVTFIDSAMISYLCLTELISIMENASKMGYTMPTKLLNRLEDMRNPQAN
jgi:phage-related holin